MAWCASLAAATCALVACGRVGYGPPEPGDGSPDAGERVDGMETGCFWPASNVDPCKPASPPPIGRLDLTESCLLCSADYHYDTTNDTWYPSGAAASAVLEQGVGGPLARVVAVTDFHLATGLTLEVSGDLPLLLVVHGDAFVEGTIVVSAGNARCDGTGCSARPCAAGQGGDAGSTTGSTTRTAWPWGSPSARRCSGSRLASWAPG